jgi:hypothetical protein
MYYNNDVVVDACIASPPRDDPGPFSATGRDSCSWPPYPRDLLDEQLTELWDSGWTHPVLDRGQQGHQQRRDELLVRVRTACAQPSLGQLAA